MSTLDMLKFWLIKEMMPLIIFLAIVAITVVGVLIYGLIVTLFSKLKR